MLVELEGLIEGFFAVTDIRREAKTPGLTIEDHRNFRPGRNAGFQFHEAGPVLGRSPFPLFVLLDVCDFGEPGRVGINLRAAPVVLVERIKALGEFHPDGGLLSGLQPAISVA